MSAQNSPQYSSVAFLPTLSKAARSRTASPAFLFSTVPTLLLTSPCLSFPPFPQAYHSSFNKAEGVEVIGGVALLPFHARNSKGPAPRPGAHIHTHTHIHALVTAAATSETAETPTSTGAYPSVLLRPPPYTQ